LQLTNGCGLWPQRSQLKHGERWVANARDGLGVEKGLAAAALAADERLRWGRSVRS